jgi:Tfp pilus assembly protein FimV
MVAFVFDAWTLVAYVDVQNVTNQANPEAFGASMNDLRTGAVLRIPDVAELEALPPRLVAREVDRAVADWRQRSGAPTRVADPGGRLRLVAPSEVSVGTGGDATAKGSEGAAKAGAAGQAGQSASSTSDETVEQRLARIERELIERQRLLEVTQSQLAELQARAAASPQSADAGLFAPLQALLGKAWWLWFLVLAAVWALVSWAMAARRRAASAESELDTYLRTRTATSAGVGMDDRVAEAVAHGEVIGSRDLEFFLRVVRPGLVDQPRLPLELARLQRTDRCQQRSAGRGRQVHR